MGNAYIQCMQCISILDHPVLELRQIRLRILDRTIILPTVLTHTTREIYHRYFPIKEVHGRHLSQTVLPLKKSDAKPLSSTKKQMILKHSHLAIPERKLPVA